jgi:dihydroorotate dehydrogenase (NAD+) catalytic subunit
MDLSVAIGSGKFSNPVGVASGTFGYGSEYAELVDVSKLGAIYTKAITLKPRAGNEIPRLVETPAGLLNSIGLANVGVEAFIEEKMEFLSTLSCAVVANVAGSTEAEYLQVLERLEKGCELWGYEINLSCPNVKRGCLAFGIDPPLIESLVSRLRRITEKPLIVKLTPNVTDIGVLAKAAEQGGADGISCINTLLGMVVDVESKRPVLPSVTGGLSGPAIRPVGVAMTYRVSRAVSVPVIGVGGITTGRDALQYLLAGASAVQVGTANFVDPTTPEKVLEGIREFLQKEGLVRISDLHRWRENWVV